MDVMEIFKEVVPVIITGIITFLITKYTYNKNIPLDKLEVAYNRIYFPVYQLIHNKNSEDVIANIPQISFYFKKYNKYVDRATLKAFGLFCKHNNKENFLIFTNNIYDKNVYLRRRLGYLEPNFFQMYTYSSKNERSIFRILVEFIIIYFTFIIGGVTTNIIQIIFTWIAIIFAIIFIVELIILLCRGFYKIICLIFKR